MAAKRSRLLTKALLAAIGALALLIVLELAALSLGNRLPGPAQQTGLARQAGPSSLNIRNIGLEQDFEEVAARPIFTWNRKPIPASPDEPQAQTSEIDSRWDLSAIIANGASHFAYFTPIDGGQQTRLEEGMYFEKWRVVAIGRDQVVLATEDSDNAEGEYEQKVFRLKEISAPAANAKNARTSLAKRRREARKQAEDEAKQSAEAE